MSKMIEKKSWDQFRQSGLLWFVNRTLHLFGWAIVVELNESGQVKNTYPARCKFRGFDHESEEEGFKAVSDYMAKEAKQLKAECEE